MQKTKTYSPFKFSEKTISLAYNELLKYDKHEGRYSSLRVGFDDETWDFDNLDEFYPALKKCQSYDFDDILKDGSRLIVEFESLLSYETRIVVRAANRTIIGSVFEIFEKDLDKSKITITKNPIKIFIGHGRDSQWKELKDHLHEKHGYEVVAYEIGPKAGTSVKDVLEKMINESSFAILVMTGEDEYNDGTIHARGNVIHETGLFQGHLGFEKAIILKEDGVVEFSNIFGLNQIRFPKGNISGTYGDVLATIKREFGEE